MTEEMLSGLAVRVTPDNWDTLKLLRNSTPPKPYVVYRLSTGNFIAFNVLVSSEKLISNFDKLDEFKLLIALGTSRNDAYKQVWLNHV